MMCAVFDRDVCAVVYGDVFFNFCGCDDAVFYVICMIYEVLFGLLFELPFLLSFELPFVLLFELPFVLPFVLSYDDIVVSDCVVSDCIVSDCVFWIEISQ